MTKAAKSGDTLKVLYGEADVEVIKVQAAAMEKAGHAVHMAIGRQAVQEAAQREAFDLVILGHTLTRDDRHHLPYMVKKAHREARVLVLHADGGRHPYCDGFLDTGSSVDSLLAKIASVMSLAPKAKAAAVGVR